MQESVDSVVNTSPLPGLGYVEEAVVAVVVVAALVTVAYSIEIRKP